MYKKLMKFERQMSEFRRQISCQRSRMSDPAEYRRWWTSIISGVDLSKIFLENQNIGEQRVVITDERTDVSQLLVERVRAVPAKSKPTPIVSRRISKWLDPLGLELNTSWPKLLSISSNLIQQIPKQLYIRMFQET